ncbi:hypothetical protein D3C80_2082450 [compost metagenome]
MEMVTGISRITSRFGPSSPAMVGGLGPMPNSSIGARGGFGGALVISASMPLWSMSPDSESAAAHSSASACSSGVTLS